MAAASATTAAAQMPQNFHDFFEKWTAEQNNHLHSLISSIKSSISSTTITSRDSLVKLVIGHYEEYYRVKSKFAQENVFLMLCPTWRNELESSFLWIGGWRPSMAFHLLYSKSGLQFEAWLEQVTDPTTATSAPPDDLGDLRPNQLSQVNQLQKDTVDEERRISEKMAKHQETIAAKELVELSHKETMSMMGKEKGDQEDDYEKLESNLKVKKEGLKKILQSADDLRIKTLKGVTEILSANQALHFLIAAAELHLRLHDWGKTHDNSNKIT